MYCYIFLPISKVVRMFATGEGLLTQEDKVTPNGLQEVFATNLFGHFLLVSWWIRNDCVSMTIHTNKLDVITNIDKSSLFFQCYFQRSIAVVEHFTLFLSFPCNTIKQIIFLKKISWNNISLINATGFISLLSTTCSLAIIHLKVSSAEVILSPQIAALCFFVKCRQCWKSRSSVLSSCFFM